MLPNLRSHRLKILVALGGAMLLTGGVADAQAEAVPGMAPGELAAPSVESLLPQLLRAHYGPPYDMAAIRFGPEFWAALQADAREQRQAANVLGNLFSGGLLFGVGPLDNLLTIAKSSALTRDRAAVRWSAPPTMSAVLSLQTDQAEIIIQGQRADWVRRLLPTSDSDNLLNQLEFIWFPLEAAGRGPAVLGGLARSMTLSLVGIAPGARQTFTWTAAPPPTALEGQFAPPLVVQGGGPLYQPPRQGAPFGGQEDAAGPAGLAMGPGGPLRGGGGLPPEEPGPEATAAFPAVGPQPGGPAEIPAAPGPPRVFPEEYAPAPAFPHARAASTVGSLGTGANTPDASRALSQAYAGVNQVISTTGPVTVDYWTNSAGRQEVDVVSPEGQVVRRVRSGPASANGQGLASWAPPKGDTGDADRYAFVVRNWVETPQGAQIAEAVVPVTLQENRHEPEGALAPAAVPVADLTVLDLSVAGEFLQVRAAVASIPEGPSATVPELHVKVTDEAGRTVKTLTPSRPRPGNDYVFAWDLTDDAEERVPDGRYVVRMATLAESPDGSARAELRYWVTVPLAATQRRLQLLDPRGAAALQARLEPTADGTAHVACVLPTEGKATAFVTDPQGRTVRHLLDAELPGGPHAIVWDGRDDQGAEVGAGTYLIQVELDAADRGAWASVAVDWPVRADAPQ